MIGWPWTCCFECPARFLPLAFRLFDFINEPIDSLFWKEVDAVPSHLFSSTQASGGKEVKAQILTERKVQTNVVKALDKAKEGDEVWIGMFYLADRDIIDAIENAADRKVDVRIVLDPNQNEASSCKCCFFHRNPYPSKYR